jgi:hypothetical protein
MAFKAEPGDKEVAKARDSNSRPVLYEVIGSFGATAMDARRKRPFRIDDLRFPEKNSFAS